MRGIFISLLLTPVLLFSDQNSTLKQAGFDVPFEPWLTGPLLATSATNLDVGHPSLLASWTLLNTYGDYDSNWKFVNQEDIWSFSFLVELEFAISKRAGIEVFSAITTRFEGDDTATDLNDTIMLLGYQLSNDIKGTWVPDARFYLQAIFPTGEYDGLDSPLRRALAVNGQGAYFFGPGISCQKLFAFSCHFFMFHWGFNYSFPTRATIRDFGVYGGGIGTNGTIRPGQILNAFLSGEYTLNQNWALAMDIFLIHQLKTSRFKGVRGFTLEGTVAQVGLPSSTQISITPSIEYSDSPQFGLLAGAWLTIAGRNAGAFLGGFLQFSYVF